MHFFPYSQEMHPSSWNRQAVPPSHPAEPEVDVISMGRRVRHLRKAAGLTLDDLSATVGTAPSQLSLIENGKREPKLGLLQQ
ncbi:helix-turn-helix domain-containing protein, partial [Paenarthrobacter sp. RAF9]